MLSVVCLVTLFWFPISLLASPPASLQDSGSSTIPVSQNGMVNTVSGKSYRLRSWFEQGSSYAVGAISVDDIRALVKEVQRLQQNPCYEVTVRSHITGDGASAAVEQCDLVFFMAHGSVDPPYLSFGGRPSAQPTSGPTATNASSVWIGACNGQDIVSALNGPSGNTYQTLPANHFQADGTAFRNTIVKGLTSELGQLQNRECEVVKKVCILAGVAEVNTQ